MTLLDVYSQALYAPAMQDASGALNECLSRDDVARNGSSSLAAGLDNFARVFAVRPDDRVLLLMDRQIDPRVVEFIGSFVRGRGAALQTITVEQTGNPSGGNSASDDIPIHFHDVLTNWATFVVSTWFSSIVHPLAIGLRRDHGQRWVKISYFRDLDYLRSSAAAFPLDVMSALLRKTAALYPRGEAVNIRITDPRGTDLSIDLDPDSVDRLLAQSRWQGDLTADKPGCYVHYIHTHGPNLVDAGAGPVQHVNGVLRPEWSVGFPERFNATVTLEIEDNAVSKVCGSHDRIDALNSMLTGSSLIELGCGFNPKWPRDQIYPAGSNCAGSLHFGMDLTHEDDFIRRILPGWPEPPVHMDLVCGDATVVVNGAAVLVEDGVLSATRDPEIRQLARKYGDPVHVLDLPV